MSTTPNGWKRIAIACTIVVVVGLTVSALFGRFGFTSICSRCGVIRTTTEWHIPLTSVAVFSLSSEHASPVSKVLESSGIIGAHEHTWLFCQGGGNGIRCALGDGRYIQRAVESEGVAAVIAASQRFGEVRFRDRLLRALFDPKTSAAVCSLGTPTNVLANASAYHAWLSQEMESFDESVARYQKR